MLSHIETKRNLSASRGGAAVAILRLRRIVAICERSCCPRLVAGRCRCPGEARLDHGSTGRREQARPSERAEGSTERPGRPRCSATVGTRVSSGTATVEVKQAVEPEANRSPCRGRPRRARPERSAASGRLAKAGRSPGVEDRGAHPANRSVHPPALRAPGPFADPRPAQLAVPEHRIGTTAPVGLGTSISTHCWLAGSQVSRQGSSVNISGRLETGVPSTLRSSPGMDALPMGERTVTAGPLNPNDIPTPGSTTRAWVHRQGRSLESQLQERRPVRPAPSLRASPTATPADRVPKARRQAKPRPRVGPSSTGPSPHRNPAPPVTVPTPKPTEPAVPSTRASSQPAPGSRPTRAADTPTTGSAEDDGVTRGPERRTPPTTAPGRGQSAPRGRPNPRARPRAPGPRRPHRRIGPRRGGALPRAALPRAAFRRP